MDDKLLTDIDRYRSLLAELADALHSRARHADPLLWAAACSVDSARLMLQAHNSRCLERRCPETRDAILDAVGSARAAVGAATFAAREQIGAPKSRGVPY